MQKSNHKTTSMCFFAGVHTDKTNNMQTGRSRTYHDHKGPPGLTQPHAHLEHNWGRPAKTPFARCGAAGFCLDFGVARSLLLAGVSMAFTMLAHCVHNNC
jgi:hypothetical protein